MGGKHTHTHTLTPNTQMQEGNLGVDPVSSARLDKGDYPHRGEFRGGGGGLGSVRICLRTYACAPAYVRTYARFLCGCAVCLLLMCCRAVCVCVHFAKTVLCNSIPSNRAEGLSGFSKWDFQQGSREILLSRLHPLTSKAKGGFPGS